MAETDDKRNTQKKGTDVAYAFASPMMAHLNTLKDDYETKKLVHFDFQNLHALEDNLVAHICGRDNPDELSLPSNSKCYFNEGKGQRNQDLTIYKSLERISAPRNVGNCCKVVCEKGDLVYTLKLDEECTEKIQTEKPTNDKIHDFCNSY